MEPDIITARNEVRARLYFHRRVWFCSQRGVGVSPIFRGVSNFFFLQFFFFYDAPTPPPPAEMVNARAVRILLECILVLWIRWVTIEFSEYYQM